MGSAEGVKRGKKPWQLYFSLGRCRRVCISCNYKEFRLKTYQLVVRIFLFLALRVLRLSVGLLKSKLADDNGDTIQHMVSVYKALD